MSEALPKRSETDPKYHWKIEDLYETNELWEKDYAALGEMIGEVRQYEGKLTQSAEGLYSALEKFSALYLNLEKLYAYALMRKDEDNSNPIYQALGDRADSIYVQLSQAVSFIDPELVEHEALVRDYVKTYEPLSKYAHYLDDILRVAAHTLSKSEERLLAMSGDVTNAADSIFSVFTNVDMKFPKVTGADGKEQLLSHGRFIPLMESEDRTLRENAYKGLYSTYSGFENTLAATYAASVKADIFRARARKFDSALDAALFSDAVSKDVYTNLINAVHDNLPTLHKYVNVKKRALGLDEMHMWDIYRPVVEDAGLKMPFEKAAELVCEGLGVLGEDYINVMSAGIKNRWVDVYENEGKTSGAYSNGVYGVHPFVLLNWNDTLDNTFTLAHELGHSMHSYLSSTNQDYVNSNYPIILAEVASTTNEVLLMEYLLTKTSDKTIRLTLINYLLEQVRTTVIRQTMFAEFEMLAHEASEKGEPLTSEKLCAIYRALNEQYYGPDVETDDSIAHEWSRIPHFYRAFYVYKYALGFSSALALAEMVRTKGVSGRDRYIEFLSSGCTDYPLNLLKKAGVDLTKPDAVNACLKRFSELLGEFDSLLND